MARYDGIECVSRIFGVALSPIVYNNLGYYGSFGIRLGCSALAILHLVIFVKEPQVFNDLKVKRKKLKHQKKAGGEQAMLPWGWLKVAWRGFYKYVFLGTWDTLKTIGKKRSHDMRMLIIVQLCGYGLSIWASTYLYIIYLYMIKQEEKELLSQAYRFHC